MPAVIDFPGQHVRLLVEDLDPSEAERLFAEAISAGHVLKVPVPLLVTLINLRQVDQVLIRSERAAEYNDLPDDWNWCKVRSWPDLTV